MEEIEMLIGLLKQKMHEKQPSNVSSIRSISNTNLPELNSKYNVILFIIIIIIIKLKFKFKLNNRHVM
jgi:hypothetical protein